MDITNVVVQSDTHAHIDLAHLARNTRDIIYNPHTFTGALWKHKRIGGHCMVFPNGKLICNGNKSMADARRRVRQYARLLQRLGFSVTLKKVALITMSAVYKLSAALDFEQVCSLLGASYNPEILNAAILKRGRINLTCFQSGTIVITGIRSMQHASRVIYPTILELELCTS